jgi:hypothetical protein
VHGVDSASEELAAAGVPVLQSPHDTGNNNRNALLRDPGGKLVEISSPSAGNADLARTVLRVHTERGMPMRPDTWCPAAS